MSNPWLQGGSQPSYTAYTVYVPQQGQGQQTQGAGQPVVNAPQQAGAGVIDTFNMQQPGLVQPATQQYSPTGQQAQDPAMMMQMLQDMGTRLLMAFQALAESILGSFQNVGQQAPTTGPDAPTTEPDAPTTEPDAPTTTEPDAPGCNGETDAPTTNPNEPTTEPDAPTTEPDAPGCNGEPDAPMPGSDPSGETGPDMSQEISTQGVAALNDTTVKIRVGDGERTVFGVIDADQNGVITEAEINEMKRAATAEDQTNPEWQPARDAMAALNEATDGQGALLLDALANNTELLSVSGQNRWGDERASITGDNKELISNTGLSSIDLQEIGTQLEEGQSLTEIKNQNLSTLQQSDESIMTEADAAGYINQRAGLEPDSQAEATRQGVLGTLDLASEQANLDEYGQVGTEHNNPSESKFYTREQFEQLLTDNNTSEEVKRELLNNFNQLSGTDDKLSDADLGRVLPQLREGKTVKDVVGEANYRTASVREDQAAAADLALQVLTEQNIVSLDNDAVERVVQFAKDQGRADLEDEIRKLREADSALTFVDGQRGESTALNTFELGRVKDLLSDPNQTWDIDSLVNKTNDIQAAELFKRFPNTPASTLITYNAENNPGLTASIENIGNKLRGSQTLRNQQFELFNQLPDALRNGWTINDLDQVGNVEGGITALFQRTPSGEAIV